MGFIIVAISLYVNGSKFDDDDDDILKWIHTIVFGSLVKEFIFSYIIYFNAISCKKG